MVEFPAKASKLGLGSAGGFEDFFDYFPPLWVVWDYFIQGGLFFHDKPWVDSGYEIQVHEENGVGHDIQ